MKIYDYEKELGLKEEDLFWMEDQLLNDDRQSIWKEQREKYGFDERETWSLYSRIALFVYPRLKMYKEYPGRPIEMTEKQWENKIDQMLTAFEIIIKGQVDTNDVNEKIVQKGLNCFSKYFLYLWN